MKLTTVLDSIALYFLCSILIGCTRNEPVLMTTPPSSGSKEIKPIASYYIGTHVAEPSGIVYQPKKNSFLVVSDSHPDLYEIDFQGKLLCTISTVSSDLEGVTLSKSGDSIFVVEEKNRVVTTYLSNGAKLSSFSADVATLPNNALEGITVGKGGNLFVLNEKSPGMIIEYQTNGTEKRRMSLSFAADYSDIFFDESGDCFWIISDESMKIAKVSMNGIMMQEWSVPFSKGEGISIVRDTMYVVNDADATMYVFLKPQ